MVLETCTAIAVCFCFLNGALVSGDSGVTWVLERSVADGHALTARIQTLHVPSLSHCAAACYDDPACITVGYSPAGPSCQLYSADLTGHSSLIHQPATTFYKSVCGNVDYTYVRTIALCVKRYTAPLKFTEARDVCRTDGGDLVVVASDERRLYLRQIIHNFPDSPYYWVGATQTAGAGSHWMWLGGDNVTASTGWTHWAPGEPNSVMEECMEIVAVGSDVGFKDQNCEVDNKFICEIPVV